MLRYIERHLLRNEAGNETAWRIQTIWDKLILVQLPLWFLNILIDTHLEIDKRLAWLCENSVLLGDKIKIWFNWCCITRLQMRKLNLVLFLDKTL
jgi:hypothetical protein